MEKHQENTMKSSSTKKTSKEDYGRPTDDEANNPARCVDSPAELKGRLMPRSFASCSNGRKRVCAQRWIRLTAKMIRNDATSIATEWPWHRHNEIPRAVARSGAADFDTFGRLRQLKMTERTPNRARQKRQRKSRKHSPGSGRQDHLGKPYASGWRQGWRRFPIFEVQDRSETG